MFGSAEVAERLEARAGAFDTDAGTAGEILPALAGTGVFEAGLARELGGAGGELADAIEAIAWVSQRSLAAGFVLWGHRTFIEYLVQSPNERLRARHLPSLLAGTLAGATGLSNAMKFLSGLEELRIAATPEPGGFRIDGTLPWVTNLRPDGFIVGAAVTVADGRVLVVAIPSDTQGVQRSADLDLMAMRASNTAAIDLARVRLGVDDVLSEDARSWLPRVRPAFLAMQCGMSIGLARRALDEARAGCGAGRNVLRAPIEAVAAALQHATGELRAGLRQGSYVAQAAPLFALRIRLAEIAQEAAGYELQAAGGRAYLAAPGAGFQRRWREAAFLPVITPSLVQLKAALAAHGAAHGAERAA